MNPPIRLRDKPRHIPHGLALLANIIRKHFDCQLQFIDWNAHRYTEKQLINKIKQFPCDVSMIGGLIPTYKYLIKIAEIIKGVHSDCIILAGGSGAMSIPQTLLRNSRVDVVCIGEGETTIIEVLEAIINGDSDFSDIKGIAYKDNENNILINKVRTFIADFFEGMNISAALGVN